MCYICSALASTISATGGWGGIRTHGRLHVAGFQDRCLKPLGHPSTRRLSERLARFSRPARQRRCQCPLSTGCGGLNRRPPDQRSSERGPRWLRHAPAQRPALQKLLATCLTQTRRERDRKRGRCRAIPARQTNGRVARAATARRTTGSKRAIAALRQPVPNTRQTWCRIGQNPSRFAGGTACVQSSCGQLTAVNACLPLKRTVDNRGPQSRAVHRAR
jgi:hypothetical protein